MRALIISLAMVMIPTLILAQDPFSITTVEDNTKVIKKRMIVGVEEYTWNADTPDNILLLRQQLFGASASSDNSNANISVNFIQYRLGLFTSRDSTSGKIKRYYLPLLVLTKLQTNYDDNYAAADDATGYDGSPLTLRLMPSKMWTIGKDNTLMAGVILDGRAIAYKDTNEVDTQFGAAFYGAIGITYAGIGDARDQSGQVRDGTWSAALLAYFSTASKSIREAVFKDGDPVGGFEFMLRFTVADSEYAKFNLFGSIKWMSQGMIDTDDDVIYKLAVGN
jgi:hypothetical protein